jgi:hypothetical protein
MMMHGYGIGYETGFGMFLGWVGPVVMLVIAGLVIAVLVKYLRN